MMIFVPFLFLILSSEKEINITEYFIGKWEMDHSKLDQNALDSDLPDRYQLNISASGEDFIGNLSSSDKSNQIPTTQIKIAKTGDLQYSLLVSKDQSDFKEFIPPLTIIKGVDNLIQAFGHINSTVSFSFHFYSYSQIEITLYNTEDNSVSFYRLDKELPPTKPPITTFQLFLPMLPVLIMMYNKSKSERAQPKKIVRTQTRPNTGKKD